MFFFRCLHRLHLDEFTIMAESYKAARAATPEVLKGTDIYFFVADFSRNQGSFQRVRALLHYRREASLYGI